jgi:hypothetical protein
MVQIMVTEKAAKTINDLRNKEGIIGNIDTQKSILCDAMRDAIHSVTPEDNVKFKEISFLFELEDYATLLNELANEEDDPV